MRLTEWEEFFDPAAPEYQEPEAQTLAQESNNELLTALDKLNDRERRIIELKFWSDLDTRSIAAVLSMTESNVRVILHRSLGKLKKIPRRSGVFLFIEWRGQFFWIFFIGIGNFSRLK